MLAQVGLQYHAQEGTKGDLWTRQSLITHLPEPLHLGLQLGEVPGS